MTILIIEVTAGIRRAMRTTIKVVHLCAQQGGADGSSRGIKFCERTLLSGINH